MFFNNWCMTVPFQVLGHVGRRGAGIGLAYASYVYCNVALCSILIGGLPGDQSLPAGDDHHCVHPAQHLWVPGLQEWYGLGCVCVCVITCLCVCVHAGMFVCRCRCVCMRVCLRGCRLVCICAGIPVMWNFVWKCVACLVSKEYPICFIFVSFTTLFSCFFLFSVMVLHLHCTGLTFLECLSLIADYSVYIYRP